MTRDEAIKKAENNEIGRATTLVDSLIALGLLKVEEPVSVRTRAIAALRDTYVAVHTVMPNPEPHLQGTAVAKLSGLGAVNVVDILEQQGFKITR